MNSFQVVIIVAFLGNLLIGLMVLLSNPKRLLNSGFFFLSCQIGTWLIAMFACSIQHSESMRLFWVRLTSAAGGLLPLGFFVITTTVTCPGISTGRLVLKLRYWIAASAGIILLCFSPVFALYAGPLTETEPVPPTDYGWGFTVFIAYFIVVIAFMIAGYRKARREISGVQKEEMSFLLMGGSFSLLSGTMILVIAEVLGEQRISGFLPLSVLVLVTCVAYGIATRRILSASVILQRSVSYGILTAYLLIVYVIVYGVGNWIFVLLLEHPAFISHLAAALAMTLSMAPAHGRMQRVAHALLPFRVPIDSDTVLKQARSSFQEVSTESRLAASFARLVSDTFGTSDVTILRPAPDGAFVQRFPECAAGRPPRRLEGDDPLLTLLYRETEPVTDDMLERMRASAMTRAARHTLDSHTATAAAGCFMRNEMKAVLLLSVRQSGRIYDLHDQRTLQLLCDQFAVAIENANLYTAVQNAKIYNDILLDALTSGIVAVDADRRITVFNQRAQQITGLSEAETGGCSLDRLPVALGDSLNSTLESQTGFRDRDMTIHAHERDIPVRVSGSIFYSHTDSLLGAMLIFTDMTELKRMEEQIRRSDRLSSIGTLSAGMAHEIKNPLVTIKTFTQLLPEQHNDPEFRRTFFELVDQEVKRIDTIVTRLLHFARPARVALQPVSLHAIVDGALKLVEQQLVRHGVRLERHLDAERYCINADADQLNQAFINFLLNATDAMPDGGTLTVRTSLKSRDGGEPVAASGDGSGTGIELVFQDTGSGMTDADRNRIFDPFFTTKEHGIGLGLSVSHGIIQEHHGIIHVESRAGVGTAFRIQFILLDEETP